MYSIGQCVSLRRRHWLIEDVIEQGDLPQSLKIACLDDDAQGEIQHVLPSCEVGIACVDDQLWQRLGTHSPADAKGYSAYLQSLQWNTATAADALLFQAPFRAGIEISPYQLAPLAKALDLPRVNLMIADDVGLGKTIEAGLVLRELMLRHRVDFVVVVAPASMTQQWQEELASKFGITADIVNREYYARMRAQRGFGYNPWTARNSFIISHNLWKDPAYNTGLSAILGSPRPRSMLILDEAHHVAPSHGQAYAIDSDLTKSTRDLARRFEHRLFLTATPHNGHSNSFAALLEMLDPQRFTRGIEVRREDHDAIMVRRLKSDLRELTDTPFPKRKIEAISLSATATDAVELQLAAMLGDYMSMSGDSDTGKSGFNKVLLQQRLLSSIPAFSKTLAKEMRHIKEPDALDLAGQMLALARANATRPDKKSEALSRWISDHMGRGITWNSRRLIVFTEYQVTLDWLEKQLMEQLGIDPEDGRIATYTGDTPADQRELLKSRFNADPDAEPLRILLCTDAAREGINLQHRCHDMFHYDLPWNPSRLEQRIGRIDRRLQPHPHVTARYFVYANRPEDRILDALIRKTQRINEELGEIGDVLATRLTGSLRSEGITQQNSSALQDSLNPGGERAYLEALRLKAEEQMNGARDKRRKRLEAELNRLAQRLADSRSRKGINPDDLQAVFLGALEKFGAELSEHTVEDRDGIPVITLPTEAAPFQTADWATLFDNMRTRPPERGETQAAYRTGAMVKKVSFHPVKAGNRLDLAIEHLHLEHRLVRRLLSLYEARGFRTRLEKTAVLVGPVNRVRVALLARLTLYAEGASSLHSEIIPILANISGDSLVPLKSDGRTARQVLEELAASIAKARQPATTVVDSYRQRAREDTLSLKPLVEAQAEEIERLRKAELAANGDAQARSIKQLLEDQRRSILKAQGATQMELLLVEEEAKQRALDKAYWQERLEKIDAELQEEPGKVRARYEVTARRLEPVGLVYLLPEDAE